MLTKEELLRKAQSNEQIKPEDIGLPSWRSECDGFYYELGSLFHGSGIAFKHKDGFRWSNGKFLTKRQCKHFGFPIGKENK